MSSLLLVQDNVIKNRTNPYQQDTLAYLLLQYLPLPLICLMGVVTNLLNIAVFLNPKMKDVSFKYMLIISIADLIYLGFSSYVFLKYCTDCGVNISYSLQMFTVLIDDYFTSCLAIFCILLEIFLSLQRLMVLENKTFLFSLSYKLVISLTFLTSLLYYLPYLFRKNILSTTINYYSNKTISASIKSYSLISTDFGSSKAGKIVPIFLTTLRIFLGTVVLTLINILNAFKFRKRFSKRLQIKLKLQTTMNENTFSEIDIATTTASTQQLAKEKKNLSEMKASRNITLMVLSTSVMYFCFMTPYNISYILRQILPNSSALTFYNLISSVLLTVAHGSTFFVYFFFNNLFRKILKRYFKKILFLN